MTEKQTFVQWKARVNVCVIARAGVCTDDLPDVPYYDWFEDGISPQEATEMVLEESGFPIDLAEDEEEDFEFEGDGDFG